MFLLKTKLLGKECQDFSLSRRLPLSFSSFFLLLFFNQKFISISFSCEKTPTFTRADFFSLLLSKPGFNFLDRSDPKLLHRDPGKTEIRQIRDQIFGKLTIFYKIFSETQRERNSFCEEQQQDNKKLEQGCRCCCFGCCCCCCCFQTQLFDVAATRATATISAAHFNTTYAVTRKKANFGADSKKKKKKKITFFTNDRSGSSGSLRQKNAFIYSFGILLPLRALWPSLPPSLPPPPPPSPSQQKPLVSRARLSFLLVGESEGRRTKGGGKIFPSLSR